MSADELRAMDTIVDLDADETTCPACGTTFAPSAATGARCPECGLNFG